MTNIKLELSAESRIAVQAAFDQLGAATTGEALVAAAVAGALNIQNAAKINAPAVTGTLRRSIHIGGFSRFAPGFNPAEGYSDIDDVTIEEGFVRLWVGTNLVYARRIEYGFVGKDRLGRYYNQRAQPYLRPAFDTEEPAVARDVEAAIDQLLGGII